MNRTASLFIANHTDDEDFVDADEENGNESRQLLANVGGHVTDLPRDLPGENTTVDIPDHWPDLNLTAQHWIAITVSIVLIWVMLSIALAYFLGPHFVKCYLCEKQILRSEWLSGEHRVECAKEHEKFLENLPGPFPGARCPICYRTLKLWPANLGPEEFTCSSNRPCREMQSDGTAKKLVSNDGTNRFNCFMCDFDMCGTCAELARLGTPNAIVIGGWLNTGGVSGMSK